MSRKFIFVFLIPILSACQIFPHSAAFPNQADNPGDAPWVFETPVEAITVSIQPDNSRQVQALIPLEGGSITATGADGTHYTLEIPADALTSQTHISMTPLASIEGLPFRSEPALAVQLEPEGLVFNNFVTLTITPPEAIPVDQQIVYSYQGKNLSLALPRPDSSEIKILLLHFSGYGVAKGLLADIEPYRKRLGGDVEARLQSEVAYQLGRVRQQQLLGASDEDLDLSTTLKKLFDRYEREVVQPRVAAAGESCAAGRLAIQTVLGFERQKQLLGMDSEKGMTDLDSLIQTASSVCLKEEYELCASDHIIHRMIPVWLGFERQAQLLGAETGESPLSKEAALLTEQCLRFDLEFYSSATFDAGEGDGYESVVRARIPIRFNAQEMDFEGIAPLVNESFEFHVKGCKVDSRRGGSTIKLNNFKYIADTHSPNDQLGYVRDLEITYFPERTSETFTISCPDSPSYTGPPAPFWWGIYLILHFDEIGSVNAGISAPQAELLEGFAFGGGIIDLPINPEEGYLAKDWEILGGEYFAKKEWIKEQPADGLIEAGTLKLYHRPGK